MLYCTEADGTVGGGDEGWEGQGNAWATDHWRSSHRTVIAKYALGRNASELHKENFLLNLILRSKVRNTLNMPRRTQLVSREGAGARMARTYGYGSSLAEPQGGWRWGAGRTTMQTSQKRKGHQPASGSKG